jgi:hypothetical protein
MGNNQYSTMVEATEQLTQKGYTHNFKVNDAGSLQDSSGELYPPSDVILQEFHRFEGITDPSDMSIIYAVETHSGLKGAVVDAYGVDGSMVTSEFMNLVKQKQAG